MKVVTAHTMQEIDRRAIDEFGIPGFVLMENAGRCSVDVIISEFGSTGKAAIIAGKGNNGGDGFVIARLLSQAGWEVAVYVLSDRSRISGDAAVNLEKLPQSMVVYCPDEGQFQALYGDEIAQVKVIVDAMLGTGLRSDVSGVYLEAIELINASDRPVVAVDIPSGIHGTTGRVLGNAVRADITVTFAIAKLGHILYPGEEYTGKLVIADIGIPPQLMEDSPGYKRLNVESIRPMLRRRDRQAHKGDFGHCLIIAGSPGKTGAAALAANSAVRAGAGLVTLAVAESLHHIIEIKTTEAMSVALPDSNSGYLTSSAFQTIEKLLPGKDALAVGPGLDRRPGTTALVQTIVESVSLPIVIDADGLYALAEDISVLRRKKSADIILTPHPGEMARLLGTSIPDVEAIRFLVAQEFARKYGVYLVLKGARTIIVAPDGTVAINGSGNPGMATGGMGDVLTGIIVALLGQHYSAWDACRLGVFIHGYAADLVAEQKGEIGMCATDVQEMLPHAYNNLNTINLLSSWNIPGNL
ncbi:MAG: NAD(P)H-hydrate dehydratase [Desulfuromonadales bacterium]|nr:NAD(P)H-hydrate dehydratase [Desulfuromonadales bacterium]